MTIDSKLPDVGTSIFTVMSALAAEHGAINLSQGFPDFDTPPALIDLVAKHMQAGRDIFIVSDEVYEHIGFDGLSHLSLLTEPERYARSFVISSFAKQDHTLKQTAEMQCKI